VNTFHTNSLENTINGFVVGTSHGRTDGRTDAVCVSSFSFIKKVY
jgi:hypothetical protein